MSPSIAAFYSSISTNDDFDKCFDFKDRKLIQAVPERPYVALLLKENALDVNIRKELPENHLSTLEDIASLVEAEMDADEEDGFFTSELGIFYVEGKNQEVFAVSVSVFFGYVQIIASPLNDPNEDGYDWGKYCRIYCPGKASL